MSMALGLAALALFWRAFTQFGGEAPQPGQPGFATYEADMVRAARLSVVYGVAGCFALLGAFAFLTRTRAAMPDKGP
ncbi:MAG: hypothetical protein WC876_07760 [Candidatus Thermoplasmatota archaeon]